LRRISPAPCSPPPTPPKTVRHCSHAARCSLGDSFNSNLRPFAVRRVHGPPSVGEQRLSPCCDPLPPDAGDHGPHEASEFDEAGIYAQIANRLSELIDDVREVGIDVDANANS
jgi:hypothetical protein